MTLAGRILEYLEAKPMTSQELAERTGVTDRHIRRTLRDMSGISSTRAGRSIFYSTTIDTDTGHTGRAIADIADIRKIEGGNGKQSEKNRRNIGHGNARNAIADIADIRKTEGGNGKQSKENRQNSGHDTGHTGHAIADIADIRNNEGGNGKQSKKNRRNTGHDTGHSGHTEPAIKSQSARNRKRTPGRHSERPQSAPDPAPCVDCGEQGGDRHACRTCPLSIAAMERDTVQFVLVDQTFRDQVLRWTAARKWPNKEIRGITWVYPGDHLSLQVGEDSVVFYSDEPGNMQWIEAWVRRYFDAIYPDIESLIGRIRSPERLTRDELTVVVTHQPTIDAVMGSIGMHMGRNKTFYLKAPNTNTPGFKAYLSNGTLRCEFDCRNQFQAIAALGMRQRLLTILPDIVKAEGLFWEFLTDYYNPYEHPIVVDTGVDSIVQQFSTLAQNLSRTFADALAEAVRDLRPPARAPPPLEEDPEPLPTEEEEEAITGAMGAMRAMMQALSEMDSAELEEILRTFRETMKLEERAALVYLAAFAAWTRKNYRGSVIIEDLIPMLQGAGTPLSAAEIADAIEPLKTAGLLKDHPSLEICFTPFGSRLGRKLVAKWRGA